MNNEELKNVSISWATLRPQHLIPSFLDALGAIAPAHYESFLASPYGTIPAYVQDEGGSSEWWASDDAQALLEELFEILDEHAPEGFFFGAHSAYGSDFGC